VSLRPYLLAVNCLNMYVYLCSDDKTTQLLTSSTKQGCSFEDGFRILLVLEVPEHLVATILLKWKRESRGPISRVNKGLRIAKKHLFRVYVSDANVGELETLKKYTSPPGVPKPIPAEFWQNL
jgi:hypothetical protein